MSALKQVLLLICLCIYISPAAKAQDFIALYPTAKVPYSKPVPDHEKWETDAKTGSVVVTNVTVPALQVFLPARPNGAAVIIFPGGAYAKLGMNYSGSDVAKAFNTAGITAFVLKYRLPGAKLVDNRQMVPFLDARRAMQLVKQHAKQWHIDSSRIGVVGFSAGGHLASSLGAGFYSASIDSIPASVVRPAFMVLVYPVISFTDSLANAASRQNLLGAKPSSEEIKRFSNELHIGPHTPPAFIVHAADDKSVPVTGSIRFYETLLKNHIPAELHLYARGGHAFGLNNTSTPDKWFDHCLNWMVANGWVKNTSAK